MRTSLIHSLSISLSFAVLQSRLVINLHVDLYRWPLKLSIFCELAKICYVYANPHVYYCRTTVAAAPTFISCKVFCHENEWDWILVCHDATALSEGSNRRSENANCFRNDHRGSSGFAMARTLSYVLQFNDFDFIQSFIFLCVLSPNLYFFLTLTFVLLAYVFLRSSHWCSYMLLLKSKSLHQVKCILKSMDRARARLRESEKLSYNPINSV